MDYCTYTDMTVTCEEFFFHPKFHDFVAFQHANGVDKVKKTGPKTFDVDYVGTIASVYIDNNDEKMEQNSILVGGWDWFDAYHESWRVESLPITSSESNGCTKAAADHRGPLEEGCRVYHSFIAILSDNAPMTLEEWHQASDEELLRTRDFVEEAP